MRSRRYRLHPPLCFRRSRGGRICLLVGGNPACLCRVFAPPDPALVLGARPPPPTCQHVLTVDVPLPETNEGQEVLDRALAVVDVTSGLQNDFATVFGRCQIENLSVGACRMLLDELDDEGFEVKVSRFERVAATWVVVLVAWRVQCRFDDMVFLVDQQAGKTPSCLVVPVKISEYTSSVQSLIMSQITC